jgi:hypothetical protein
MVASEHETSCVRRVRMWERCSVEEKRRKLCRMVDVQVRRCDSTVIRMHGSAKVRIGNHMLQIDRVITMVQAICV